MNTTSSRENGAAPRATDAAALAAELLRDPSAPSDKVRSALNALSDDALRAHGLDAYRLNLLAVANGRMSREEVLHTSRQCVRARLFGGWSGSARVTQLTTSVPCELDDASARRVAADDVRLSGWMEADVAGWDHDGAVIAAFHLGAFRMIPMDLIVRGYRVVQPLNTDAFNTMTYLFRGLHPAVRRNLVLVDVEQPHGALRLMREARRGGVIVAFVDGNTGADGPMGEQARTEVDLLGLRLRVKHGVALLAARLGRPIVPVHAVLDDPDDPRLIVGAALRPRGQLSGETAAAFAEDAIRALYADFDRVARTRLGQWEALSLVHRWRVVPRGGRTRSDAEVQRMLATLRAGGCVRFDDRWIAPVSSSCSEPVWVDVRSLRVVRSPGIVPDLAHALGSEAGLTLDRLGPDRWPAVVDLLTPLLLESVISVDSPPTSQLSA